MITEHQIFPRCHLNRFICINGNTAIFLQMFVQDTAVFSITLLNIFFYFLIRTSVCQTKLPVCVTLCPNRIDQFLEIWGWSTVQRNHNTDQRILLKMCMSLFSECTPVSFMAFEPLFIVFLVFSIFVFMKKASPESFGFLLFTECFNIDFISLCCGISTKMKYDTIPRNFQKSC